MMNTIINEKRITFNQLEKEIFNYICRFGRELAKGVLEKYDNYLMESRDKSAYRHKGLRETTVKTLFGEVTYKRALYRTIREDGTTEHVFLLDENLQMKNVGLISRNLAEKLVGGITEMSYRECAGKTSEMTGQSISAMGVWNVIQALGEEVCQEEKELVKEHKAGHIRGEIETPVLFEETDGIYLKLQGEDRKMTKDGKAEMKVGIAYDGWKKAGKDRYLLQDKVVVAGFSKAKDFHDYREASIAEKFNLGEVDCRILNADGASWIKKVKDKSTCFQLDPFHRNKAIREKIHDRRAQEAIRGYLAEKDLDGMFDYLETYRNSLAEDAEIEDVTDLIRYFEKNREGLLPYQEQDLILPEHPEGLEYRNMGTMENHVWSVIAKRMKRGHRTWSLTGGNHLAKILAKKCSGRLHEVTERLQRSIFEEEKIEEIKGAILMSGQVAKKVGKGYDYPAIGHIASLDTATRGERKRLLGMAGF